jgi:hypothetical protein
MRVGGRIRLATRPAAKLEDRPWTEAVCALYTAQPDPTQLRNARSAWHSHMPHKFQFSQFSFDSFIGSGPNVPHVALTLADDGADANFISEKFLQNTRALKRIRLIKPIACEG